MSQIRTRLKKIAAIAPYTPPTRKSFAADLFSNVISTYEIAKTIGIPPIAPASLGPENFARTRIIAVTTADARLFKIISIVK